MPSIHILPGLVAAFFLGGAAMLSAAESVPLDNTSRPQPSVGTGAGAAAYTLAADPSAARRQSPRNTDREHRPAISGIAGPAAERAIGTHDFNAATHEWKAVAIDRPAGSGRFEAAGFFGAVIGIEEATAEERPVPVPSATWLFASGLIGLASVIDSRQRRAHKKKLLEELIEQRR